MKCSNYSNINRCLLVVDAEVGLGGGEKAALCARMLYADIFSLVPCDIPDQIKALWVCYR